MVITEDDVKERLTGFNYTFDVESGDLIYLRFAIKEASQHICNFCNVTEIPNELEAAAVDMAVACFLKAKRAAGALVIEGLDFSGVVTSLKEGDTQVNIDGGSTSEAVFDAYIDALYNRDAELVTFRKLRW
jgi:hypothetical protein